MELSRFKVGLSWFNHLHQFEPGKRQLQNQSLVNHEGFLGDFGVDLGRFDE